MTKSTIDEIKASTEALENPATGLHNAPLQTQGLPRPGAQLVDRQRMVQAWEATSSVLKATVGQLEANARAMRTTRIVTLLAVAIGLALGWLIWQQALEVLAAVKAAQVQVAAFGTHADDRMVAQERKLDGVLSAMAQLLEAKLAEDAAKASPKDQDLKREATRTRVQALGSALAAKKEVTPAPQVAREVDQKLRELKQQASEKGIEVQIPSP